MSLPGRRVACAGAGRPSRSLPPCGSGEDDCAPSPRPSGSALGGDRPLAPFSSRMESVTEERRSRNQGADCGVASACAALAASKSTCRRDGPEPSSPSGEASSLRLSRPGDSLLRSSLGYRIPRPAPAFVARDCAATRACPCIAGEVALYATRTPPSPRECLLRGCSGGCAADPQACPAVESAERPAGSSSDAGPG